MLDSRFFHYKIIKFFLKPDVKVLNIRGITALKHILPLAWALTLTLPAFSSELSVCETGGICRSG